MLLKLIGLMLKITVYIALACLVIALLPGIPPNHVTFEEFTVTPRLNLEGKLAPNTILNNVKEMKLDEDVFNPESISVRTRDGVDELYMGDRRGKIIQVKNGKVKTIVDLKFPCDIPGRTHCSWPLGTRFDHNGKLLAADAFGGLIQVDVDKGTATQLVPRFTIIGNKPVGFAEDMDVAKDGTIYWSDGSSLSPAETIWNEFLGNPTGRFLKYDPKTKQSTVLIKDLHFANGVQLSPDEDFVLVAETIRSRVHRYYLKGSKKGQSDIFLDGLPGIVDNIRSNNKGGFFVHIYDKPPPPLQTYPLLRRFLCRVLHILTSITGGLYRMFPNDFTLGLNINILNTDFKIPGPQNGLIIEVNGKGQIIGSLQSTNGALWGVSQMTRGAKHSYFVTPSENKIWYIETKEIIKN